MITKTKPQLINRQKPYQAVLGCMGINCHLTRDSEQSIVDAGFIFKSNDQTFSTGGTGVLSSSLRGIAAKP